MEFFLKKKKIHTNCPCWLIKLVCSSTHYQTPSKYLKYFLVSRRKEKENQYNFINLSICDGIYDIKPDLDVDLAFWLFLCIGEFPLIIK